MKCVSLNSSFQLFPQAYNKPMNDRKMVALYLHHDSPILTNVFCTQVCIGLEVAVLMNFYFLGFLF